MTVPIGPIVNASKIIPQVIAGTGQAAAPLGEAALAAIPKRVPPIEFLGTASRNGIPPVGGLTSLGVA